jgi:hypothetical protein
VCVGPALGTDIVGRAGLTVFKNRSAYRLYDSTTGAYQTIDSTRGAASALATTVVNNKVIVINEFGIFETDGVGPLKNVSEQLGPLWDPSEINVAQLNLFCAGTFGQRAYFSLPRAGATANNLMLEYHSEEGWITANSNAASCYAPFASAQQLYMGSPSVNGQVYQMFSGGTTTGRRSRRTSAPRGSSSPAAPVAACRTSGSTAAARSPPACTGTTRSRRRSPAPCDHARVGVAAYAPDLHSLGVGRAFSLRIDATTSSTFSAPALLGGAQPTVGAVGLYELAFFPIALGLR